ncbi:DUF1327 domain-containing protein [Sodalis ligni]|uniref:DUF1327 domain-containing protein n=1 Tax=Sodalis ligni TaxID=2697027 RepID=UPI00193FB575|nr:DUF1327 domain-containing protein [Sodalis ligni]QWA09515.1 DUF1327 domain-containing protein [Sodalis ligni]
MEQKFEFSIGLINPNDDHIEVSVAIGYSKLPLLSVANLQIVIDRTEGKSMEFYEEESIKAAKGLIKEIASEL